MLILDVARFKYPPHWVPLKTLWEVRFLLLPGPPMGKPKTTPTDTTVGPRISMCLLSRSLGFWGVGVMGVQGNIRQYLGGGFKYFLLSPLPGEMIQFD